MRVAKVARAIILVDVQGAEAGAHEPKVHLLEKNVRITVAVNIADAKAQRVGEHRLGLNCGVDCAGEDPLAVIDKDVVAYLRSTCEWGGLRGACPSRPRHWVDGVGGINAVAPIAGGVIGEGGGVTALGLDAESGDPAACGRPNEMWAVVVAHRTAVDAVWSLVPSVIAHDRKQQVHIAIAVDVRRVYLRGRDKIEKLGLRRHVDELAAA